MFVSSRDDEVCESVYVCEYVSQSHSICTATGGDDVLLDVWGVMLVYGCCGRGVGRVLMGWHS